MRLFRLTRGAWLAPTLLLATPGVRAQSPVPLSGRPQEPIEAADISEHDVELFGRLASLWQLADGTQVIEYVGDFALHMGQRRLSAQEAVIWMRDRDFDGRNYRFFEVFLHRRARVREPAGTVTTGEQLFVTFSSFGQVALFADKKVFEPAAETNLYEAAQAWRSRLVEQGAKAPGVTPLPLEAPPAAEPPKPRLPVTIVPGKRLISEMREGERLVIALGGIYLSQGAPDSSEFLEIRADNAVLFLPPSALERGLLEARPEQEPGATRPAEEIPLEEADRESVPAEEGEQPIAQAARWVSGAYLEGDVVLSRGERVIRSPSVYYDFETNRALILDAVMSVFEPTRGVPIVVRARQVRQLSSTEYSAVKAKVTSSEFHTPHYHIGAERVYLQDRTPGRGDAEVTGLIAGSYKMYHTTLNVEGVPVAYWPYARGDFKQSETILRSIHIGYSDDYGGIVRTKWYLANLLGLEEPEGFDSTLRLDYLSERGPGVGIDIDYLRDDYYGLFRSYYINDRGTDDLGGFRDDIEPDTENRGRILWRHRHYLPKDWELTLEFSYISDPTYLEQFEEDEFDAGKKQETVVYLKKQKDNWAVTALANWRLVEWDTQTEHLPDLSFFLIGQPLGEIASAYTEAHAGVVRYRPDDRRFFDRLRLDNTAATDSVARGDLRQEFTLPVKLGPVRVVPFAMIRGGGWSDTPHDGGSEGRVLGQYGLRSNMYLSRLYPGIEWRLLDVHDLRHVIKPELIAWLAHSNLDSRELTPFDEGLEDIDEIDGVTVAVRQRLQTKRGGPGNWRVVDWVTFDLEAGFFSDAQYDEFTRGRTVWYRPENSITQNYIYGNAIWRITDSTAVLTDFNWDLDEGKFDTYNLSLAVERTPRLAYFFGWRFVREIESNLLGFGANYQISAKHTIAFRNYYDIDLGRNAEFTVTYIRKWPRWYTGLTFELDDARDTVGVSLVLWPEGAPEAAVGPRKYTRLASSTAIAP